MKDGRVKIHMLVRKGKKVGIGGLKTDEDVSPGARFLRVPRPKRGTGLS